MKKIILSTVACATMMLAANPDYKYEITPTIGGVYSEGNLGLDRGYANGELIVYYHNYKDEFYRHQLHYNIKFVMRMFDNFKIKYNLHLSSNSKTFVDYQAIDYAKENNADLIICQTTKNKSWFEELFTLKERKVINNSKQVPVLFVNPREDLFILCE
jgi:hypothetical protein